MVFERCGTVVVFATWRVAVLLIGLVLVFVGWYDHQSCRKPLSLQLPLIPHSNERAFPGALGARKSVRKMLKLPYAMRIVVLVLAPYVLAPVLIYDAGPTRATFALGIVAALLMTLIWFVVSPAWSAIGMRLRPFVMASLGAEIAGVSFLRVASYSSATSGWTIAIAGAVFFWLVLNVWMGTRARGNAIDLVNPLPDGFCVAAHGGSTSIVNYHHANARQKYAIDMVCIAGPLLAKSRRIGSGECRDYATFNARVVAPCDGKVSRIENDLDDQLVGNRDQQNPLGNHIVLDVGDGALVELCHLKRGSIFVRPGQIVSAGDVLAAAGNSGNTTEPHLHIHAERDGEGVPITIDGRRLYRNVIFGG